MVDYITYPLCGSYNFFYDWCILCGFLSRAIVSIPTVYLIQCIKNWHLIKTAHQSVWHYLLPFTKKKKKKNSLSSDLSPFKIQKLSHTIAKSPLFSISITHNSVPSLITQNLWVPWKKTLFGFVSSFCFHHLIIWFLSDELWKLKFSFQNSIFSDISVIKHTLRDLLVLSSQIYLLSPISRFLLFFFFFSFLLHFSFFLSSSLSILLFVLLQSKISPMPTHLSLSFTIPSSIRDFESNSIQKKKRDLWNDCVCVCCRSGFVMDLLMV